MLLGRNSAQTKLNSIKEFAYGVYNKHPHAVGMTCILASSAFVIVAGTSLLSADSQTSAQKIEKMMDTVLKPAPKPRPPIRI